MGMTWGWVNYKGIWKWTNPLTFIIMYYVLWVLSGQYASNIYANKQLANSKNCSLKCNIKLVSFLNILQYLFYLICLHYNYFVFLFIFWL